MNDKEESKMGRPTKYEAAFCERANDYLQENIDEYKIIVNEGDEGESVSIRKQFKVKLPTLEGFAIYIGVNKDTLNEWKKKYPNFSVALGKISQEQHQRLIDSGLSGEYNSTIAKLILSSNHGYKERSDQTTNDKDLPIPILGNVHKNFSNKKDNSDEG